MTEQKVHYCPECGENYGEVSELEEKLGAAQEALIWLMNNAMYGPPPDEVLDAMVAARAAGKKAT